MCNSIKKEKYHSFAWVLSALSIIFAFSMYGMDTPTPKISTEKHTSGMNALVQKNASAIQKNIELRKNIAAKLQKQGIQTLANQQIPCPKGDFFVYAQRSLWGRCVPTEIAQHCSMLTNIASDFPEHNKRIPVPFSIDIINKTFDTLKAYNDEIVRTLKSDTEQYRSMYANMAAQQSTKNYNSDQLVAVINCLNSLLAPQSLQDYLALKITQTMNLSKGKFVNTESFKELYPTLQKQLTLTPALEYLEDMFIKKNTAQPLILNDIIGSQKQILSYTLSPDDTKMIITLQYSVVSSYQNVDLIDFTKYPLLPNGLSEYWNVLTFTPDGKSIIASEYSDSSSIFVIFDIANNKQQKFDHFFKHCKIIALACHPNNQHVAIGVMGAYPYSLALYDIKKNTFNYLNFKDHIGYIAEQYIAFSNNGKRMMSYSQRYHQTNPSKDIVVWEVKNDDYSPDKLSTDNYIPYQLPLTGKITFAKFSHDSTRLLVGCDNSQDQANNLFLCDIRDPKNIVCKALSGHQEKVIDASFNYDDTKIVSASDYRCLLWTIKDIEVISCNFLAKEAGEQDEIRSVDFSPQGNRIIAESPKHDKLVLWNVNDPLATTSITFDSTRYVPSNASLQCRFNNTGTQVISLCLQGYQGPPIQKGLQIWTLFTPEQKIAIDELQKSNASLSGLLYRLCSANTHNYRINLSSSDENLFHYLPDIIKNIFWNTIGDNQSGLEDIGYTAPPQEIEAIPQPPKATPTVPQKSLLDRFWNWFKV